MPLCANAFPFLSLVGLNYVGSNPKMCSQKESETELLIHKVHRRSVRKYVTASLGGKVNSYRVRGREIHLYTDGLEQSFIDPANTWDFTD